MKCNIYACLLITSLSLGCFALDRSAKATKPKTFTKSLEEYYPMEIELKDNDDVSVSVLQGEEFAVKNGRLSPNERIMRFNYTEIGIRHPIYLELYGQSAKKRYKVAYEINPAGKTIYLKIENGKILPRVGSLVLSKTPSGLSIKNNISADQMIVLNSKEIEKIFPQHHAQPTNVPIREPIAL